MRRGVWLAVAIAGLTAVPTVAADWTTWGDGTVRSGHAHESSLTAAAAPSLKLAWKRPLGGAVDAQPLYLRTRVKGASAIYVAATERGRVFAFDARNGKTLWRATFQVTKTACAQLPGGIFGATGTPVYDPARKAVYLASYDKLYAFDVRTGKVQTGWPLKLAFNPAKEHVWGALAQRGPYVYLATASYCDREPYKGRVLRVDVRDRAVLQWVAVSTPEPNGGGGIWGWGGVSIDPANGDVWAATANAQGPDVKDERDYDAESVVHLTANLQKVAASKAPGMPASGDYGFGSTPMLFRPAGCPSLAAALGKNGTLYLWRRATLGKGPYQRVKLAAPATLYGLPAWDAATRSLYVTTTIGVPGVPSGLQALKLDGSCRAHVAWHRPLGSLLSSVPTIANDVVAVNTGTGTLRIYRAKDGQPLARFELGGPVFVPPVAVGRDLAVAGWNRELRVYRLPPG